MSAHKEVFIVSRKKIAKIMGKKTSVFVKKGPKIVKFLTLYSSVKKMKNCRMIVHPPKDPQKAPL